MPEYYVNRTKLSLKYGTFLFLIGNNFYQERGSNQEIFEFVSNLGVKFPIMAKMDCSSDPLFVYLAEKMPDSGLMASLLGNGGIVFYSK